MLYDYIAECDLQYPNTVSTSVKQKWLERLEKKLTDELVEKFDCGDVENAAPYPNDEVYVEYLKMKCAEAAGDIIRYNNYLSAYAYAMDELCSYYVRKFKRKKEVEWKNVL